MPGLRTHHYLIWWMKTYDDWLNISSYSMSSINASITRNNSWNILQTFVNCQSLLRHSMAIHQLIKCLNGWEQSLKFHLTDYSNLKIMHLSLFSFWKKAFEGYLQYWIYLDVSEAAKILQFGDEHNLNFKHDKITTMRRRLIPYNCHFFYTDTIFVRIKFTPKNADFSR